MRHGLHIIMALMSCCFLCFNTGCRSDIKTDDQPPTNAQEKTDNEVPTKTGTKPDPRPVFGDSTSPETVVVETPAIPPAGGPILPPPSGGGGGSQGATKPARTGNPDRRDRQDRERICDDKEDNDGDGLIDCEDPDCRGQACNDMNGCTINETCQPDNGSLACIGEERECNDSNECTMDFCEPVGMDNEAFSCIAMFDESKTTFSSCTPEGNCEERNPDGTCALITDQCIAGRCAVSANNGQAFICEEANLVDLTLEEGGCKDLNPCSADMCKDGICMYSELDNIPCETGNTCATGLCNMGDCDPTDVPDNCTDSSQCGPGSLCLPKGSCQLTIAPPGIKAVGEPCFSGDDCADGEFCDLEEALSVCTCDDENPCTFGDMCLSGICAGDDEIDGCEDDADCFGGLCVDGACACDDGNDCTEADVCAGGICGGAPVMNGITCQADTVSCVENTCLAGECSSIPDDTNCSPGVCQQDCTCDIEFGCVCKRITGPSDEECELDVAVVAADANIEAILLAALNTALVGQQLECDIGFFACVDGELDTGICTLSNELILALSGAACTESNLEASCTLDDSSADFALLVTPICAVIDAVVAN
jgi:hypothetical protein